MLVSSAATVSPVKREHRIVQHGRSGAGISDYVDSRDARQLEKSDAHALLAAEAAGRLRIV